MVRIIQNKIFCLTLFHFVDIVGCFELPHSNSPLQKTPEDPKVLQTKFYLFRRNINFSEPEIVYHNDNWLSLNNSKYNYTEPLKVVVHGYLSNWNEKGNLLTADAYRKLVKAHFFLVTRNRVTNCKIFTRTLKRHPYAYEKV